MERSFGIFCILLGWAVLLPAMCGLGWLATRAIESARGRPAADVPSDPLRLFWIGFAALLLLLQLIHLALPIRPGVTYVLLGVGWVGFVLSWRAGGREGWKRCARLGWLLLPMLGWVALQATNGPEIFDNGLYHFQSIRWANEQRIVPGLGNLDGRLGFNQSYFLYVAFLNAPPLIDRAYHFANSLLYIVLAAQMLRTLREVILRPRRASASALFQVLLLPMIIREASPVLRFERGISSPTPDLPIVLLGVLLVSELISLACPPPDATQRPDARGEHLTLVFILSAAAITMKLSFLVAGVLCVACALWLAWRDGVSLRGRVLGGGGMASALLLVWMARGVVTNGCPLYPSPLLSLPVSWRVPPADVQAMANLIKGFARQPGTDFVQALHGFSWLPAWWARVSEGSYIRELLTAAGALLVAFALLHVWRGRRLGPPLWRLLLPLVPPAGSLLFWFWSAPEPRFWTAMPSCAVGWLATLCLLHAPQVVRARVLSVTIGLLSILLALPENRLRRNAQRDALDWVDIPKAHAHLMTTESGVQVYVPDAPGQLWNHELPCTTLPKANLAVRGKRLRDGFTVAVPGR